MEIRFTKDQQKVIDLHDRNILVSAAAGSGKTAVLVERIVQLICDEGKKIDIDKLLIVTFTSAAAAEMRERISDAIFKKLDENPQNEHLQKQSTLLHNAQITTISSLCLFILRNHFNDIGLDPAFRVADEGELKLLRKDVMSALLEEKFAQGQEEFHNCVEAYASKSGEKALEDYILKLYDFASSYPWPQKWLEQCEEEYQQGMTEDGTEPKWMTFLLHYLSKSIQGLLDKMKQAKQLCMAADGPYMYAELIERECEYLQKALSCTDYRAYTAWFATLSFDRLSTKKDESVSSVKREQAKTMRTGIKDRLQALKKEFFFKQQEIAFVNIQDSFPVVKELLELAITFLQMFAEKKKERNIIDFSDMEHFALDILVAEENGQVVWTQTAQMLQEHYEEILIDEYQDSNLVQEYLLKSISREDRGTPNRFMVGDVKQSIYKFRLARPELFMEKYETYSDEESKYQKIDLQKNFRSRKEVIEGVNYIFEQIMGKDIGGITYNEKAALYQGANYQETGQNQALELLLVEKSEDKEEAEPEEDCSTKELEALGVAMKIKEMRGKFLVTDKGSGQLRPAKYGDMVILLRSNAGWDEEFKRVLLQEGIPTHVTSKTGYFSAWEIQLLLNFLRILDNPLQDIPLGAVLLSPLIGWTQEELATIKAEQSKQNEQPKKRTKWYQRLECYQKNGENVTLQKKASDFLQLLDEYRRRIPYTPIHELLQELLQELNWKHFISAMPGGEQRCANVDMLMEKAVRFESTSYRGLFHFIRYIEQLEKFDVDFGEANTLEENADTVRIMSIHKSKGLEFPICFVSGLAKRFNKNDIRKPLIIDMDYGIGADYVNPQKRVKMPTLRKNSIIRKMELESLGEEIRILYVALTRAKEKLILTASVTKLEKKLLDFMTIMTNTNQTLPFDIIIQTNSYLDLVMAALIRHSAFEEIFKRKEIEIEYPKRKQVETNIVISLVTEQDFIKAEVAQMLGREELFWRLEQTQSRNVELQKKIEEEFSFVYPHESLARLYTKTTVSELKKGEKQELLQEDKQLYPQEEMIPYLPKFMRKEEKMTGTARGSAYHKVLELLNMEQLGLCKEVEREQKLREELDFLLRSGKLTKEYSEAVKEKALLAFLQSEIAERMARAAKKGNLYKEQPFVMAISANRVEADFPNEERILVQGIIDVYWEEEDGIVVADYKTDQVTSGQELIERYRIQLEYYAEALETLLQKPVKEKLIYSFALGQVISLG